MRKSKQTKKTAGRRNILAKVVVPLACLAAACGVFFLFLNLSPYNAPLALAVFLTAVACIYDLEHLKIPWWIPGALIAAGPLYYISLWQGLLPVPHELKSLILEQGFGRGVLFIKGNIFVPLFWVVGLVISAFLAWFAFNLIGTGQQDFAIMIGVGALIPARVVPNLAGVDPIIYVPSIVLNTVTVGALAALLLYIVYRFLRPAGPDEEGVRFAPDQVKTGSSQWPAVWRIIGVLCVVAFWIGVRYVLPLLLNPASVWYTVYVAMAWILICISSFLIFPYIPVEAWFANAFAVFVFVPTFLPVPSAPGIWFKYMLLLPLLALTVVMLFSTVMEFITNRVPWLEGKRFPFVPAILVGLLLTTLWGDFVFGWVYPHILPLWRTI